MSNTVITMDDVEKSIALQLHDKLEELFGQGNQAFCMEYPPRNLNARDYAYTIEDNTGVLFKPQTVAEAEFNLSDQMLDLASFVQGSTGEKVSNLFKAVLNNYIPRLHYATRMAEEKGKLKAWLLESIKGHILEYDEKEDAFVPREFEGTRMEYSAQLYRTYLYKRQAFNQQVNDKKQEARDSLYQREEGHKFSDWLATVAATKEEVLNTFYQDAVVRGNLHEVNSAISFLDIPSLGQRLNEIKRDIRANVKRSVIGGGDIYTVNFSPSNWFESLTQSPSPIDVITNSSYRESLIRAKSNELKNARQQLSSLQNINVDDDERDALVQQIKNVSKDIDDTYTQVRKNFQGRLVTAVELAQEALAKTAKFAVSASTIGLPAALNAEVVSLAKKKARTTDASDISSIEEITKQTEAVVANFVKLDKLRQEDVELQAKLALAKSSDYASQIKMLQHQINTLSEDLKALESEDALYPSSLEQLKNDVTYASNEAALSGKGLDASVQEDIEKLLLLDNEQGNNTEIDFDNYSHLKTSFEKVKEQLNSLTDVYGGTGSEDKLFDTSKLDDLFDSGSNKLVADWKDKIAEQSLRNDTADKKAKTEDTDQKISDVTAYLEANQSEEQDQLKRYLEGQMVIFYPKLTFDKANADYATAMAFVRDVNQGPGSQKSKNDATKCADELSQLAENLKTKKQHEYTSTITSLAKRLGVDKSPDEKDDYYQTITIEVDTSSSQSMTRSNSSASSKGKSYDYWFSAGSSNSSSSDASSQAKAVNRNLKITIKLRATKVTIERGGWFGVDILRLSEGMFHVDPGLKSATGDEENQFKESGRVKSQGKFTHYPMSFLIVKDVEITKSSSSSFSQNTQSSSSSSSSTRRDGWFSSSHNESSRQAHYQEGSGSNTRYFETITIPNPSIIGWFQQIVPKDDSFEYAKTQEKKEEFGKTIDEFLKSVVFK